MIARRLLLILLPLLIAGCGFHLRGETRLPDSWSPIYMDAEDFTAVDRSLLRSELERAGARVVDRPDGASRLWIELQPLTRRSVASSSLSSVSLWHIELSLDYGLEGPDGREIIPRSTLRESTSIELDTDNPLTARSRLQHVEWRLRQALIRQLVFRLGH